MIALKNIAKVALLARPVGCWPKAEGESITILANGPSLAKTIEQKSDELTKTTTLAVNFAVKSDSFFVLRPRYYVLADPHFFSEKSDPNLAELREKIHRVDWPMTLFVPRENLRKARALYATDSVEVLPFNFVGLYGDGAFQRWCYRHRLAMPRPRNVLVPSLMIAMWLGYKDITIYGADHTWMQTLSVTDDNEVVSIQPHFYADSKEEHARVSHEYRNIRLHDVVESFSIAFRSYHFLQSYATSRRIRIINATPSSMIDAFPRIPSPQGREYNAMPQT